MSTQFRAPKHTDPAARLVVALNELREVCFRGLFRGLPSVNGELLTNISDARVRVEGVTKGYTAESAIAATRKLLDTMYVYPPVGDQQEADTLFAADCYASLLAAQNRVGVLLEEFEGSLRLSGG